MFFHNFRDLPKEANEDYTTSSKVLTRLQVNGELESYNQVSIMYTNEEEVNVNRNFAG